MYILSNGGGIVKLPYKTPQAAFSLSFGLALAAGLLLGSSWLPLFWLAAAIHECGHLIVLKLLRSRVEQFRFRLSGAEIRYAGGSLSYGGEVLLALAGPLTNLLCACLCAPAVKHWPGAWLYRFIGCHLVLAVFNLLPALPLDGGRVLKALLEARFPLWGEQITGYVSAGIGLVLVLAGLFLLRNGGNLTLFSAGMVILLRSNVKNTLHLPSKMLK